MSVREYIGARYVPIFAEPLEWDATRTYEPLTVVLYQGNSFTSRQAVPANIPITNTTYWAQTGNYNAQIEQYRAEVATYGAQIAANTEAITNETSARESGDTTLAQNIASLNTELSQDISSLSAALTAETTARENADTSMGTSITNNTTSITAIKNLLPASSFSSSNTVKNQLDAKATTAALTAETQARIASINALTTRLNARPLFVLVGDSWTDVNTYGNWLGIVRSCLAIDVLNYGYGGTGWAKTNGNETNHGTFANQLEYAFSQMTDEQKYRTSGILVVGGVNDFNYYSRDISQAKSAIVSGMANLRTIRNNRFPNATIYAATNAMAWGYNEGHDYASKMYRLIKYINDEEFSAKGIIPLENTEFSMLKHADSFDGSKLHLTQSGAYLYGDALAKAINGGYNARWTHYDTSVRTTTSGSGGSCSFRNTFYTFDNGIYGIEPRYISIGSTGTVSFDFPTSGGGWMFHIPHFKNNEYAPTYPIGITGGGTFPQGYMSLNMNNAKIDFGCNGNTPQTVIYNGITLKQSIVYAD